LIDDMENSDSNIHAFLYCNNCNYSKSLMSNTKIMSSIPEGIISSQDYINESNYRNKIHLRTMPRTRNFNCPNSKCPAKTGNLPTEAIFFRKQSYSYDMVYVCINCLTIKLI
jgi:DNA-directed RNA polymerase subunit M/transcription elongation factor TFIIS